MPQQKLTNSVRLSLKLFTSYLYCILTIAMLPSEQFTFINEGLVNSLFQIIRFSRCYSSPPVVTAVAVAPFSA